MTVAAASPWPTQSPTINAIRPSSRSTTSYQSPPTCRGRVAGWYRTANPPDTLGPEDRVLQRQCGFPLLVELVHALETLAETPGQHREQCVVLRT